MIDSSFIIKYTGALYSTSAVCQPRYDEFRDMFSAGQIKSKKWLINGLNIYKAALHNKSCIIVGAWFGTLGMMIKNSFPDIKLTLLDIDPRCSEYTRHVFYNMHGVEHITQDMFNYDYTTRDIIINTSCEHIKLDDWLKLIPAKKLIVLQSNNYRIVPDHINCVDTVEEFVSQAKLSDVWFSGELDVGVYKRFMIIGMK